MVLIADQEAGIFSYRAWQTYSRCIALQSHLYFRHRMRSLVLAQAYTLDEFADMNDPWCVVVKEIIDACRFRQLF